MTDRVWPPTSGFYLYRALLERLPNGRWLRGPEQPVCIWFGPPSDPVTGELLERSYRWQALLDGRETDIDTVWPFVAGNKITETEYENMRGKTNG